jgi:hypothetical protein
LHVVAQRASRSARDYRVVVAAVRQLKKRENLRPPEEKGQLLFEKLIISFQKRQFLSWRRTLVSH